MGKGNILSELKKIEEIWLLQTCFNWDTANGEKRCFYLFQYLLNFSPFCKMGKIIPILRKSYFVHEIYLIPLGKLTPPMRKTFDSLPHPGK